MEAGGGGDSAGAAGAARWLCCYQRNEKYRHLDDIFKSILNQF